jgi:hypothetical protein
MVRQRYDRPNCLDFLNDYHLGATTFHRMWFFVGCAHQRTFFTMVSKEFLPNKMKKFETNCRSKVASKKKFPRSKLSIMLVLIKSELSSSLFPPFCVSFSPGTRCFPMTSTEEEGVTLYHSKLEKDCFEGCPDSSSAPTELRYVWADPNSLSYFNKF